MGPAGQVVVVIQITIAIGALAKHWQANPKSRSGDQRTTWKGLPPV